VIIIILFLLFSSCEKEESTFVDFSFAGTVIDAGTSLPVEKAKVHFYSYRFNKYTGPDCLPTDTFDLVTDASGHFSLNVDDYPEDYQYKWYFQIEAEGYFEYMDYSNSNQNPLTHSNNNMVLQLIPHTFLKHIIFHVRYVLMEPWNYWLYITMQGPDDDWPFYLYVADWVAFYNTFINEDYKFEAIAGYYEPPSTVPIETCRMSLTMHFTAEDPDPMEYELIFDNNNDTLILKKYHGSW
jgi:hypothetical protein